LSSESGGSERFLLDPIRDVKPARPFDQATCTQELAATLHRGDVDARRDQAGQHEEPAPQLAV
jgi:hypothetical protein